ncbi:hypothetical protein [Haematobacter genomosp. 1]|uniref:Uncharacterized protein n=1 Tax=Haematobacter genomosp. 1 TaxID=366618 RepID=A0A212AAT0_9RHOB|nr:hypothetical protein [Haematobacter genomosp. 1]OWJ77433.1 hypothetical protein CDV49_11420 [Haematobacter genomosp. 1]
MSHSYNLEMQMDDLFISLPMPNQDEAVFSAYEHLLGHFPDHSDLAGLPGPITEHDLHEALEDLGLSDRASFSIKPNEGVQS